MTHVEQWARVRARTNCQLRRGAWYRVVELAPVEVVLEVNRRLLRVPRPFVQVLPIRHFTFTACFRQISSNDGLSQTVLSPLRLPFRLSGAVCRD